MTKLKAQGWQIDKIMANLETRHARCIKATQTSSFTAQPECKSYKTTLLVMKTAIYQAQCDWSENRCLFVLMHKLEVQKPKKCVVALPLPAKNAVISIMNKVASYVPECCPGQVVRCDCSCVHPLVFTQYRFHCWHKKVDTCLVVSTVAGVQVQTWRCQQALSRCMYV